jgi:hypothetical protein
MMKNIELPGLKKEALISSGHLQPSFQADMFGAPVGRYAEVLMPQVIVFLMDVHHLKAHQTNDQTIRALNRLERTVVNIITNWDEKIEDAVCLPAETTKQQAERDVQILLHECDLVDQTVADRGHIRTGLNKLIEKLFDKSVNAPLAWAWLEKNPGDPRNQNKILSEVFDHKKLQRMGLFLSDLNLLGDSHETILQWPTIGLRHNGSELQPQTVEPKNGVSIGRGLPNNGASLVRALQRGCWTMAEELWEKSNFTQQDVTIALHAMVGSSTLQKQEKPQEALDRLAPMALWVERLLEAGADPEQLFEYKVITPYIGDFVDRFRRLVRENEPAAAEKHHARTVWITTSHLVLAYTNMMLVKAGEDLEIKTDYDENGDYYTEGDDDDEEANYQKVELLLSVSQPWIDVWAKQWKSIPPRQNSFGMNQQSVSCLLFDTFLESRGEDKMQKNIRLAVSETTKTWGKILTQQEKVSRRAAKLSVQDMDQSLPHTLDIEGMLALTIASPLNRQRTNTLSGDILDVFSQFREKPNQSYPAELLFRIVGAIGRRVKWPDFSFRSDQTHVLNRFIVRMDETEQNQAKQYLAFVHHAMYKGAEEQKHAVEEQKGSSANSSEMAKNLLQVSQAAKDRVQLAAETGFPKAPSPEQTTERVRRKL